jgi:hypothetical protein
MEIAQIEPRRFSAGITVQWTRSFENYLYTDGYTTAIYTISGSGGNKKITGTYLNGVWTFTLSVADNTLSAGIYTLYGYVQKGSGASAEIHPVYKNTLEISVSLIDGVTVDTRSVYQKQLDWLNNAITNFATEPVIESTIQTPNGTRHYRRPDLKDLISARLITLKAIRDEAKKTRARNGRGSTSSIPIVYK